MLSRLVLDEGPRLGCYLLHKPYMLGGKTVGQSLQSKLMPRSRPGTAVSNGAEIAVALLVFFLFGFFLDRWLDTQPVFMIALSVFSMIGVGIRTYYVYNEKMKTLEDDRRNGVMEGQS